MTYIRHKFQGGRWLIKTTFGYEYTVKIEEVSNHHGLAFTGPYSFEDKYIGVGCFPMNEIIKMKRKRS